MADADRDRSGRLDGMRGENRSAGACGYAWEGRESADGDEHGREGGHHFGMFGREEVERVAGVDQPDRCLRLGCGDCGRDTTAWAWAWASMAGASQYRAVVGT